MCLAVRVGRSGGLAGRLVGRCGVDLVRIRVRVRVRVKVKGRIRNGITLALALALALALSPTLMSGVTRPFSVCSVRAKAVSWLHTVTSCRG